MATHSSILAWEISWTEEPGGTTGHGATKCWTLLKQLSTHTCLCYARVCVCVCVREREVMIFPPTWSRYRIHPSPYNFFMPFCSYILLPKVRNWQPLCFIFSRMSYRWNYMVCQKKCSRGWRFRGVASERVVWFFCLSTNQTSRACLLFFFSCAHVSLLDPIKQNQFLC